MEVITYKKQTSKAKHIIEAALEYKPQFFFRKKNKSRGFYSRKYGKKKFAAARVKIFLVTRISGNKRLFLALCTWLKFGKVCWIKGDMYALCSWTYQSPLTQYTMI